MNSAKTVAFHTLGCKLNFAETSAMARKLSEFGYQSVAFEQEADFYVINTCSVTEQADRKCRKIIGQTRRRSPSAKIVLLGCYAQLQPDAVNSIAGVDLVLGTAEKFRLPEFLHRLNHEGLRGCYASEIAKACSFMPGFSLEQRTRAFLKVQDGCDYNCAFCTIPLARGRSRSDTIDNLLMETAALSDAGIREIVLTGVNTGDFRSGHAPEQTHSNVTPGNRLGLPDPTHPESSGNGFLSLIRALDGVRGIDRFRISSIEPNLLHDDVIAFVAASEKFVPHFHIPLQSGSDRVLGLMRRRYRKSLYAKRVDHIRSAMPEACIGADVIVGFPGETKADFRKTFDFVSSLGLSYLHVFTYSERPNTPAAGFGGSVPVAERNERSRALRALSEQLRNDFYLSFEGTVRKVLFESAATGENMLGFTDNYIRVSHPRRAGWVNEIVPVRLTGLTPEGHMKGNAVKPVQSMA